MPVLVKGGGSGSGGGGYKYPIGDPKGVDISINDAHTLVSLKWTDPEDTSYGKWKGTLVVAKFEEVPTSIEDGIIVEDVKVRNKYATTPLVTSVGGVGYYYGIFPYTDRYVVNNREENTKIVDGGVFKYKSWEEIAQIAESGNAQDYFNIGDKKNVTINGSINVSNTRIYFSGNYEFIIVGFNHHKMYGEDKTAGISLMSNGKIASAYFTDQQYAYIFDDNYYNQINSCIESGLSKYIKTIERSYNQFGTYDNKADVVKVNKYGYKVFLPKGPEFGAYTSSYIPSKVESAINSEADILPIMSNGGVSFFTGDFSYLLCSSKWVYQDNTGYHYYLFSIHKMENSFGLSYTGNKKEGNRNIGVMFCI